MLKRVVLIAALAALFLPAAAFADGVIIGFQDGNIVAARPTAQIGGTLHTTNPGTIIYVSAFTGTLPGTPSAPTYGTPPTVFPPGGAATPFNFGSVSFATGSVLSYNGSNNIGDSTVFNGGGFITVTSNAAFAAATGGAVPTGTTLFSGQFDGPVTMTQINTVSNPSPTCGFNQGCNYHYQMVGAVSGVVAPALLAHLNLGTSTGAAGFIITLNFGFNGFSDTVGNQEGGTLNVATVPEPGTLALFGTGLISLAGIVRRRLSS